MAADKAGIVDDVIRERCTLKFLADEPLPAHTDHATVEELASAAGWAPFHRPSARVHQEGEQSSIVPWRFHLVDAEGCRALRDALLARGDKTKIPKLLAAATALVQATWLPTPPKGEPVESPASADGAATEKKGPAILFEATEENMEHVAAAGAAVQSLLLAATARGIPTFWSSGGALRKQAFPWLGIPEGEILLGSIFLFPPEPGDAEVNYGGHRERRGQPGDWSRWATPDIPAAPDAAS